MHDLVRSDVSSRCHTCKTSKVLREKNRIICEQLGKAFGRHKGVIGWQLDNEIYPYNEGCFCENCKSAFRTYLKDKFKTEIKDPYKISLRVGEHASNPSTGRWR